MRYILVDGYNVIRADPRLQSLERVSLEHAREVLVRTLASSPRLAGDAIAVVFDATRGTRQHVHSHRMGRIEVIFSAQGQTADDVIVSEAARLSGAGAVVVVSNDVAVRENCRALGCEVSGSENLLQQIPGRPRSGVVQTDNEIEPTLSTVKRGNPRRTSRKARRQRDFRF